MVTDSEWYLAWRQVHSLKYQYQYKYFSFKYKYKYQVQLQHWWPICWSEEKKSWPNAGRHVGGCIYANMLAGVVLDTVLGILFRYRGIVVRRHSASLSGAVQMLLIDWLACSDRHCRAEMTADRDFCRFDFWSDKSALQCERAVSRALLYYLDVHAANAERFIAKY